MTLHCFGNKYLGYASAALYVPTYRNGPITGFSWRKNVLIYVASH